MQQLISGKFLAVTALAAAALGAAGVAHARSDVMFSIGINTPVYAQPAPVYVQPAPVYAQPAPVYMEPQPVYVQPAPVYVRPAPVVVAPRVVYGPQPVYVGPRYYGWGHERRWERDDWRRERHHGWRERGDD